MVDRQLEELAEMLRERNVIDARIGQLINRPMTAGHAGEWIASRIFDIELEPSAVAKAIDGRFRTGPLAGRSVNVKWYLKREGLLDMTEDPALDYYLLLAGPKASSRDDRTLRPWRIDAVYLFDAQALLTQQRDRGVKTGVAAGVRAQQWQDAEIYPTQTCQALILSAMEREKLRLFAPTQKPTTSKSWHHRRARLHTARALGRLATGRRGDGSGGGPADA